jgi:hypothetical protein
MLVLHEGIRGVLDLGSGVRALRTEHDGKINGLLLEHERPDGDGHCRRELWFADRPHSDDVGPRWSVTRMSADPERQASTSKLTVREIIPCSTCGRTGYIRAGRWIDAADWDEEHIFTDGLVFHETWEGEIPEGCLPRLVGQVVAYNDAREQHEAVDWDARARQESWEAEELAAVQQQADLEARRQEATDNPVLAPPAEGVLPHPRDMITRPGLRRGLASDGDG